LGDGAEPQEEYSHIWLFHAQSGLCGMLVRGDGVQVNKRDVRRLVILQHGDEVQIGPLRWTYQDIFSGVVPGGAESSLAACSYCTSPFEDGQVFIRCPLCLAIYHDDCWISIERKRCCTRGCRLLPNKLEVQAHEGHEIRTS
jgi:hypothetical protein